MDCSPKELFQFLTKPSNLISVSPDMPSLSFHSPGLMLGKGQLIHFDLNYGLFRVRWCSKITEFRPYEFMEDTQQQGPFKHWIHKMHFEGAGTQTLIRDEIEYDVGYGPLGSIMETLVIKYQIENFLRVRNQRTTEKFQVMTRKSA